MSGTAAIRSYADLLQVKAAIDQPSGPTPGDLSKVLFPFQADIVRWAIRRGRAAIFADCGLGKTLMQLEWMRHICGDRPGLIVAPLGVTQQTIDEASRHLDMSVRYVTAPTDDPVQITNYERVRAFAGADYGAIVLDESSILKSLDGKTRKFLIENFRSIPYRLCCTATPAPNDLVELGNHADFLGVLTLKEMSATFFVKDSNSMHWRLKGHAADAFYEWMVRWACYTTKPSDLGYANDDFILPKLSIEPLIVDVDMPAPGRLFAGPLKGVQDRSAARRMTIKPRIDEVERAISEDAGQWIVWCGLNDESSQLAARLGDSAVEIRGSTSPEDRERLAAEWISGKVRTLITKPSIYGFGMNFHHCSRVAFLGIGDSYEQYYQAIRRCWRFGQKSPVRVVVVSTDLEECIVKNIERKERQAASLASEMASAWREHGGASVVKGDDRHSEIDHHTDDCAGDNWRLMMGDSAERLKELKPESVGLSVFSPPFVSLYTYTATPRDLGNSKNEAEFMEHFQWIVRGIFDATATGRLCCVHVTQIPAMLVRDGYIGIKDFRAETVKLFQAGGFVYHGEVVIDKDPQAQAIRTKSKSLLFVQLRKDASWLRPALADYILVFRKPGESAVPIKPDLTNNEWIEWARPIWYGIRESDTLQYRLARSEKDERHICPLQLGVIERCVRLWSNSGDLVLSPFAGIGSEGYEAVRLGRRFVGCELKAEYYNLAAKNLRQAESKTSLFAEEAK